MKDGCCICCWSHYSDEAAAAPGFYRLSCSVNYGKVLHCGNMVFSIYSVWIGRLVSLLLN